MKKIKLVSIITIFCIVITIFLPLAKADEEVGTGNVKKIKHFFGWHESLEGEYEHLETVNETPGKTVRNPAYATFTYAEEMQVGHAILLGMGMDGEGVFVNVEIPEGVDIRPVTPLLYNIGSSEEVLQDPKLGSNGIMRHTDHYKLLNVAENFNDFFKRQKISLYTQKGNESKWIYFILVPQNEGEFKFKITAGNDEDQMEKILKINVKKKKGVTGYKLDVTPKFSFGLTGEIFQNEIDIGEINIASQGDIKLDKEGEIPFQKGDSQEVAQVFNDFRKIAYPTNTNYGYIRVDGEFDSSIMPEMLEADIKTDFLADHGVWNPSRYYTVFGFGIEFENTILTPFSKKSGNTDIPILLLAMLGIGSIGGIVGVGIAGFAGHSSKLRVSIYQSVDKDGKPIVNLERRNGRPEIVEAKLSIEYEDGKIKTKTFELEKDQVVNIPETGIKKAEVRVSDEKNYSDQTIFIKEE